MRQVCEGGLKVPGQFQSTHSLRSATMGYTAKWAFGLVSIHALLAECDSTYLFITSKHLRVSIHALLAECDPTNPTRREITKCFNPRTPCGVRQTSSSRSTTIVLFQSTHSLRSATFVKIWDCPSTMFQSTHSLRSATMDLSTAVDGGNVSIHALLAECDSTGATPGTINNSFNPRTPCGVRPA